MAKAGAQLTRQGWLGRVRSAQRPLALAASLVVSALAIVSGIDRETRARPDLAASLPLQFGPNAQAALAHGRLAENDFGAARGHAEAAVLSAPIEPDSTALLGAARAGSGDLAGAERAFLVAGRLGWRTPITQFYWMQGALDVGDERVAALRLDAILRADPALVGNRNLLAPLEASEAGREALSVQLRAAPDWLERYGGDVDALTLPEAAIRADVLGRLARSGHPLGCVAAGPLTRRLVYLGDIALGNDFWRRHCPGRSGSLIADRTFGDLQVNQPASPFDWTVIGDSDVSVTVDPAGAGQQRLLLASSASFPRKILMQLIVPPPGNYRLSWSATVAGGAPRDRIVATVSCRPDAQDWLTPALDPASKRYFVDLSVDASCTGRWIGFGLLPGNDAVSFGSVDFRPR
ncbi:hypothetical protein H7F51_02860 [Novosphingobium flavum]|uniref:Tetratricopeptide repeat protein n=1 Tax=Novosphingobium flavum TaxID=1778672 RepID=A0A7X1KKQ7_9SPHN|nr:hypothetical protein [Novosphingobium flavum]MBC2664455.1 hypothetical protein [Novosphingobium flavum]